MPNDITGYNRHIMKLTAAHLDRACNRKLGLQGAGATLSLKQSSEQDFHESKYFMECHG